MFICLYDTVINSSEQKTTKTLTAYITNRNKHNSYSRLITSSSWIHNNQIQANTTDYKTYGSKQNKIIKPRNIYFWELYKSLDDGGKTISARVKF